MVGVNEDPMGLPQPVVPLVGRRRAEHHWVLGTLVFLILIAGIGGVVVAMMTGQTTVAIIVALFTAAIVAGSTC